MEEAVRIKKILQGDIPAFNYFVETYQDMAITIAFRICNNRQDAEDIVQDAFVKAFRNLHIFRKTSKFSTWLYRIVYNTALTHLKSNFYTTEYCTDYAEIDVTDTGWSVLERIEEEERTEMINKALKKLPSDYATILTLFYLEELSVRDIVQVTGLSQANVKVKLHRARKQLVDVLQIVKDNES